MIQITSYRLIVVGLAIRYLMAQMEQPREDIVDIINKLYDSLTELNFTVSVEWFDKLLDFKEGLLKSEENLLSNDEQTELNNLMNICEEVIFAEAHTKHLFQTVEGRYNAKFLLEQPERLFAENVYKSLSEISATDFSEGFKCLVFGRATAAAFHILRATEGVLKDYYYKKVKREREKKPMWGNMVEGLRAKKRGRPSIVLLDSLDMIRKSYRNPTNHPEAIYTLEQAQDLLGVCIDVVNKMVSDEAKSA